MTKLSVVLGLCAGAAAMKVNPLSQVIGLLQDLHTKTDYYAARNKFERFRGFLELINRFEFEFCRCVNYFLKDSNFLVCSKFNHTQCGRTCACAVACLCPHNSNSNVVVSLTIHDNVHIHKTCRKNMKPSWKVKGSFNLTFESFVILGFCLCLCLS